MPPTLAVLCTFALAVLLTLLARRTAYRLGFVAAPRKDRWQARIHIHARMVYLGTFKSKEEAMAAYRGASASARVINRIVLDATRATIAPATDLASPADRSRAGEDRTIRERRRRCRRRP